MMLYAIGFTQKKAQEFFALLRQNGVRRLVDIRINPGGQLSGFAKQDDLPYFLAELADNCAYIHMPELAPTKELMESYRSTGDWSQYVQRFEALLDARNIPQAIGMGPFLAADSCLLCSEPTAVHCHRRLVAERLAKHWPDVEIIHL
jgi:uncharacterized protein (DUF488 family)